MKAIQLPLRGWHTHQLSLMKMKKLPWFFLWLEYLRYGTCFDAAIKSHKYSKTNSLEPATIESHSPTTQGLAHAPTISDEDEKIAWFFLWLEYLRYGTCFDDQLFIHTFHANQISVKF